MLIALVVVGALILGLSPGLAVIGVAVGVLLLDSQDPSIVDSAIARLNGQPAG